VAPVPDRARREHGAVALRTKQFLTGEVELRGLEPLTPCLQRSLTRRSDLDFCWREALRSPATTAAAVSPTGWLSSYILAGIVRMEITECAFGPAEAQG
jgi:hypothetical protein